MPTVGRSRCIFPRGATAKASVIVGSYTTPWQVLRVERSAATSLFKQEELRAAWDAVSATPKPSFTIKWSLCKSGYCERFRTSCPMGSNRNCRTTAPVKTKSSKPKRKRSER